MRALLLLCASWQMAYGGQAPYNRSSPVGSADRVYAADQTSNSISVIDPSTQQLLGLVRLGSPLPASLRATYRNQLLVHGLGYSPDGKTLAAVCVGSNAVVLIDTSTSAVKNITYVGRAPHEAMWTPDGSELWVSVRGQDFVEVLDGKSYAPITQIKVPDGPGMVVFAPDGRYAYICSSFSPRTVIIDTATRQEVGSVVQNSAFCPNIAASPDGKQVWFTLKDAGKVQVFSGQPPFNEMTTLETGPITNHVNFAENADGQLFAYVTVGGLNAVKVYNTTGDSPQLVATINDVGDLPHGIWPSGDGTRMYVGLENGNAVVALDTVTHQVVATIPAGGQSPMAMVYVPGAVHATARDSSSINSTTALSAPAKADASEHVHLKSVSTGVRTGTAVVNNQGMTDLLQVAVSGLEPKQNYTIALSADVRGSADAEPVASFTTFADGSSVVSTIGRFRVALFGDGGAKRPSSYLVVALYDGDRGVIGEPVMVQEVGEGR